jgi:homoaconitase/3-isopropylmalate dehydratase large subunit
MLLQPLVKDVPPVPTDPEYKVHGTIYLIVETAGELVYQLKLMERRLTVAQLGVGILPQPAIAAIIEPDEKKRAVLLKAMREENPVTDPDPNTDPDNPDNPPPGPGNPEPPPS